MSQVFKYLKTNLSKYLAQDFDPSSGYNFIRDIAFELSNFGFGRLVSIIYFPFKGKTNVIDPFSRATISSAYDSYKKGELEKAWAYAEKCHFESENTNDKTASINALHLMGRINHDKNKYEEANNFYDKVLELSEQYNYPDAFAAAVHEKSRIAKTTYKLIEAEAGFRFALDYYAVKKDLPNMTVAINQLRDLAEVLMDFSRGPLEANDLIKSLGSSKLNDHDDTGFEFLEIRSLAVNCVTTTPEQQFFLSSLVRKSFQLNKKLPGLAELALNEAEYLCQFLHEDNHITIIKKYLKDLKTTELRKEPFKVKPFISEHKGSNPYNLPERAAENIEDLLDFLQNEDKYGSYVYRGQTSDYNAPLLPSAFRDILKPEYGIEFKSSSSPEFEKFSLKGCGSSFVGEYNNCFQFYSNPVKHLQIEGKSQTEFEKEFNIYKTLLDNFNVRAEQQNREQYVPWRSTIQKVLSGEEFDIFLENENQWLPLINNYHKRLFRSGSLYELFGYSLSTTFAQQYGLSSEGLDATKSIDVACFFATHDSRDFQGIRTDGTGVVYRFPYEPSDIVSSPLRKYNYYNMPSIVDVQDIMYRFERPGLKKEDSVKCFEYYFGAVFKKGIEDLDLLFLPDGFFEKSRVAKQKAVIIFPDEIRKDLPGRKQGKEGMVFPEYRYIEDLSKRKGVEKFYFQHKGLFPSKAGNLRREDLWPRDDDLIQFTIDMMMAQYPLSVFVPQRLDLIDGGYEQTLFNDYCISLSKKNRISLFDGFSQSSASSGIIIL